MAMFRAIIQFLESLDFSLLNADESRIEQALESHYYRFQNAKDIQALFITLSRLKKEVGSLESLFVPAYQTKIGCHGWFARFDNTFV